MLHQPGMFESPITVTSAIPPAEAAPADPTEINVAPIEYTEGSENEIDPVVAALRETLARYSAQPPADVAPNPKRYAKFAFEHYCFMCGVYALLDTNLKTCEPCLDTWTPNGQSNGFSKSPPIW